MKVGLVSPYDFASPGGVTDHVRYLAGQLRARGEEVRIFAPSSRSDIDFDTPEFYRIGSPIAVPVNDSVARITLSFHLANRVAAIIEQEAFDVPALPITMLQTSTTANVGTFHAFAHSNIGYYYGRSFLQPYLDRIHKGIAVSEPARTFFNRYFPDFPLRVIPNGIDVNVFKPGLAPIRHLRDDSVNILFVGRLEKRKGLGDLLRGYEFMKARIPHSRLIVVGDGPARSSLTSRAIDFLMWCWRDLCPTRLNPGTTTAPTSSALRQLGRRASASFSSKRWPQVSLWSPPRSPATCRFSSLGVTA